MKGILSLIIGSSLMIATSTVFAATKTDLATNWICTTNASSSSVAEEKAADDQMANTAKSAADAFAFAATNCRDCTKITCNVQ
ncbi:hypothetical protein [Legionella sp.]|uniref:hypothetical protein n=1 Tax=Legionella sp. TaxID=459 RepID=UPI003C91FAD1